MFEFGIHGEDHDANEKEIAAQYFRKGVRQAKEYRMVGYLCMGAVGVIGIISVIALASNYVTP
jgi:hypothetical protein